MNDEIIIIIRYVLRIQKRKIIQRKIGNPYFERKMTVNLSF